MKNHDRDLLRFYLSRNQPEAQRWNLSPANLSAELSCRSWLMKRVRIFKGMRVCNIGIGVGEWDDFLGYWLEDKGRLTSVDNDAEICSLFRYRQRREGHTNPATVLRSDVLEGNMPRGSFDLVTLIGSTALEARNYQSMIGACLSLLKDGGRLFYMDFYRLHRPSQFRPALARAKGKVEAAMGPAGPRDCRHFLFLATRAR